MMVTEFGGIDLRPGLRGLLERVRRGGRPPRSCSSRYADAGHALLSSPVVAGFCYTQLTDTAQERNGLLTRTACPRPTRRSSPRPTGRLSAAVPADAIAEIQIVHAAQRADRHDAEEQGDL